VQDGEAVRIADTDEQFVEAVVELLTFVEVRTALARAGRQWAEQHLDMDAQVRAYEALYASLPAAQTQPVPGRSA
jgi:glycosyltransferase involved in cell wall biosynthesis